MNDPTEKSPPRSNFRRFFVRGLAILLPSVLTIWILIAAYQFVQGYIAAPINRGVKTLVLRTTVWPTISESELEAARLDLYKGNDQASKTYRATGQSDAWLREYARREKLERWWSSYSFAPDLIGLVLAVIAIYIAGLVLGSFIGRRLYHRGEELFNRLPLVRNVYPAVKQVTDFFVGEGQQKLAFSRVVAVEYPRKGLWSVGMVTGDTMRFIEERAGLECLTVFIPSSPTPFTGYVITIPKQDTLDLPITIEEALKFVVSGGVLIPPSQQIVSPPAAARVAADGNGALAHHAAETV